MIARTLIGSISALCICACALFAQAPTLVPMSDPAYAAVDRLAGAGLVDTLLVGQRPYTREEFAAIVRGLLQHGSGGLLPGLTLANRRLVDALAKQFGAAEIGAESNALSATSLVDALQLTATTTNEQPRWVPPGNGAGGETHALIAPLALEAQSGGRDAMRGSTFALESWHHFAIGSHVMIEAHPRFRLSTDTSFAGEHTLSFRELSANTQLSNMVVSVGRQQLEWGLARHAKLFLSANAPGLDMVRLSNAQPWALPGFLRGLGANSASIFLADLGPRQYFPHTKLIGYKWSIEPTPDFELGLSALNFMGGAGAPKANLLKRIVSAFLFPRFHFHGYDFANTMAGIELQYRLKALADAQLYWEMDFDDFDMSRLYSAAWADDGAHVFGLHLPDVGANGQLATTFEFHHTGTRFNRHAEFLNGPTVDGFLLGEPLGPDADGGYAYLDWNASGGSGATLELADEAYRDNQYAANTVGISLVHVTEYRPQERRLRAMLTVHSLPLTNGLCLSVQGGLEHVNRFNFVDGAKRTDALLNIAITYHFGTYR